MDAIKKVRSFRNLFYFILFWFGFDNQQIRDSLPFLFFLLTHIGLNFNEKVFE